MTHDELCDRAVHWLSKTKGRGVVMKELVTYAMETPDAIGFQHHESILVECKSSRADFLSDKKKFPRMYPQYGMGNLRYYMCPPNMIKPEEIPEKWGLLWAYPTMVRVVVEADPQTPNLKGERTFMYSIVRRIHNRGCLKELGELEEADNG